MDEKHAHAAGIFFAEHFAVDVGGVEFGLNTRAFVADFDFEEELPIERVTTTPRRSSSLLPCSMALMQASETAVFRSFDAVGGEAHDFGDTGGGAHGDLFEAEPGGEAKFSDDRNVDHDSTSVAARWR